MTQEVNNDEYQARLATILIALTFFGCKGPVQTSAASEGDGGSAAPSGEGVSSASASGSGLVEARRCSTFPTVDEQHERLCHYDSRRVAL